MGLRRSHLWTILLTLGHLAVQAPAVTAAPRQGPAAAKREAPKKNSPAKAKASARRRPPGVRGMFEVAQELYDAGKYGPALTAYETLLKKYPGHEPAVIQTAKTLYRLDRIKDAYAVFARISPQHLDPETSYEYGWSFYTHKAWEGALYAFQRVPKGHALYDLANYYGAICAIKLRKYEDAEDMLEKAVVLPDKLAKSRSLYVKHVQALRLMQQKSALAKERGKEKDALDAGGKKKGPKVPEVVTAGEYVHLGAKEITKSAKIKYEAVHQYIDHHELKESTFDSRVTKIELESGFSYPFGGKPSDKRRTLAGLGLSITGEDRMVDGQEQRIIISEDEQDLQRAMIEDLGTTDVKSGIVALEPWIEFPLPENLWLAVGGEVNYTFVDFDRAQRTGYRQGYGELNGKTGPLSYGGSAAYKEIVDAKTHPITTVVEAKGYVEREIASKLVAEVALYYSTFDYLDETLELSGPDSSTELDAFVTQEMPLGFKAELGAGYLQQTNFLFYDVPTYGQVAADGQSIAGRLKLTADPFPFVSASISQKVIKTTWAIDNEAAREPFELTVPSYIEEFTASVALNLAF